MFIFALASFMLALIVLKKFRSFQQPNRIARTLKKRKGRERTPQTETCKQTPARTGTY